MPKNIPILIGAGTLIASGAAFFMLQQQVKPLQSDLASAKQSLVSAKKEADTKPVNKTDDSQNKSNENSVITLSADAAYASYQNAAQKYLEVYITEANKVKGPLQNVDKNEALADTINEFGNNGVPDTSSGGNDPAHLLFEPFAYKDPVMSFSALTPQGNGVFNGRLTVTSKNTKPVEIDFLYDTNSNTISKTAAYVDATPSESSKDKDKDVNDPTTDVPTNPIFPNPEES